MESGEWRTESKKSRKMGSILRDKSFAFAIKILGVGEILDGMRIYSLSNQVVKSGTSIGANIREARNAQGPKDMISKLSIALKEADETDYWLDLLNASSKINEEEYQALKTELNEIISMLVASVKTLKQKANILDEK